MFPHVGHPRESGGGDSGQRRAEPAQFRRYGPGGQGVVWGDPGGAVVVDRSSAVFATDEVACNR